MVVLAATPAANESAATMVTIGIRLSILNPYRTSCRKSDRIGYPRLRSRIVAWVGLVLLVGLVAALATEWALPNAAAAPMSGGTPVSIDFNPASVGHNRPVVVTVTLSQKVTSDFGQIVYLTYPLNSSAGEWDKNSLIYPPIRDAVTVLHDEVEVSFTIYTKDQDGWLAVLAKSSGGRVGNLLEIKD